MSAAVVTRERELSDVIALWLGDAGIKTETCGTLAETPPDAELVVTDGENAVPGKKTLRIVSEGEDIAEDGIRTLLRPFTQAELLSAVRELLDGPGGELLCDHEKKRAVYRGASVQLTNKEYELFDLLLKRGTEGVTRQEASVIARRDGGVETNAANVYIHHLRRKLTSLTGTPVIKTVRGQGYRIDEM